MSDQDSHDRAVAARATDLIADFHARHEAWRRQGENLERLRADARAAAALEATSILTTARGDIRRTIVDARRALLALTEQLQAITQQPPGSQSDPNAAEDVPHSVLQARRDLARLLTDVRPELDELAAQTEQFVAPTVAPFAVAKPAGAVPAVEIDDAEHSAVLAAIAPLFETEMKVDRPASVAAPDVPAEPAAAVLASQSRFAARSTIVVLAIVTVTALGGGGWWLTETFVSEDLAATVASIPPAPRDKPQRLTDQMLTIDATLVEVPSGTAADPSSSATPPADPAAAGTNASR